MAPPLRAGGLTSTPAPGSGIARAVKWQGRTLAGPPPMPAPGSDRVYSAVAWATSTLTPGPMVELSAIFFI